MIFCQERGMSTKDTSFATSMSEGLVREYAKFIENIQYENVNSLKSATEGEETLLSVTWDYYLFNLAYEKTLYFEFKFKDS